MQGVAELVGGDVDDLFDERGRTTRFTLLHGEDTSTSGVRIRRMIRARGAVEDDGPTSRIELRFAPVLEASLWLAFGSLLTLASVAVVVLAVRGDDAPWMAGVLGTALFGGFVVFMASGIRSARRTIERDVLDWCRRPRPATEARRSSPDCRARISDEGRMRGHHDHRLGCRPARGVRWPTGTANPNDVVRRSVAPSRRRSRTQSLALGAGVLGAADLRCQFPSGACPHAARSVRRITGRSTLEG